MIQRSPTYVVSRPSIDKIANWLRHWLPREWAYYLTRFKNIQMQRLFYKRSRVHRISSTIAPQGVRQGLDPTTTSTNTLIQATTLGPTHLSDSRRRSLPRHPFR